MDVSVVIINWNSAEFVGKCLRSLAAHRPAAAVETIVADNGSFDGCETVARNVLPEVKFLQLGENLGFAKANNRAAREARGRYLLFLNPDTELMSDAIGAMVRFLDRHPGHQAAGCMIVGPDGRIQLTCARGFPSPLRQFGALVMADRIVRGVRALASVELPYWDHRDERDVECLSGACMMVRGDAFRALGGFDERLFMYAEDVDLCYRIRARGGAIRYLAGERIMHYGAGSTVGRGANHFAALMQRQSNLYFMRKHFGRGAAAAFRWAVAVGSLVRVAAAGAVMPLYPLMPGRLGAVRAAFVKYLLLALWAVGLRRVRIPD